MKRLNLFELVLTLISLSFISISVPSYAASRTDYNQKYDPSRNPITDLKLATSIASKQSKYVLVMVGGEWCTWCKTLDAHFKKESDMYTQLNSVFEIMKVNFSKENKNEAFLSPLEKAKGYPHFYIFNAQSELISSIDSSPFKKDKAYINQPFNELVEYFSKKIKTNTATKKENGED